MIRWADSVLTLLLSKTCAMVLSSRRICGSSRRFGESLLQRAHFRHAQEVDYLLEPHHTVHRGRGRTIPLQRLEQIADRTPRYEQRADGEDHDPKSEFPQAAVRNGRRPTSFCPVEEERDVAEGLGDTLDFLQALQGFDEDDVGACILVLPGAFQRGIQTFDGPRVGARNDREVGGSACRNSRFDLCDHLSRSNHLLTGHVTAPLRGNLILEVEGRNARVFVRWGEERIASELLLKLGVSVSARAVRRYMYRRPSLQ